VRCLLLRSSVLKVGEGKNQTRRLRVLAEKVAAYLGLFVALHDLLGWYQHFE
jgi:hypothetical protein